MATAESIYHKVNEAITEDIKKELRLQGHYLTGALERSIEEVITEIENGVSLGATAADYLQGLEKGVPASQIQFSEKTLDELTKYVELRMGYRGGKARTVAYRILQKHMQEGMPTESSRKYSKSGERTKAVAITFEHNDSRYGALIDSNVGGLINSEFDRTKSGTV